MLNKHAANIYQRRTEDKEEDQGRKEQPTGKKTRKDSTGDGRGLVPLAHALLALGSYVHLRSVIFEMMHGALE